jgi:DNA gyrase subunit A
MIPEASRTAKGSNIVNILDLSEGEKITAMICVDRFADDEYLTMITKNGTIKRTAMSEYAIQRKGGKIALSLADGDELLYVALTNGERDLMIATKSGLAIRFAEKNVRPMGRTATGVRGIKLVRPDDCVVGAVVVDDEKKLLVLTERGYGKRVEFEEFNTHGRGGQGMKCVNAERTGDVAGIVAISDDDDIIAITDDGTMIRTPAAGIPHYGRAASGVIMMKLSEGSKIVNFALVAKADVEEDDEEADEAESVDVPETETTEE